MGKEQSPDIKNMSEEELKKLLIEAQNQNDYEKQIELCRALLPYQERPCLALTAIKELENFVNKISKNETKQN